MKTSQSQAHCYRTERRSGIICKYSNCTVARSRQEIDPRGSLSKYEFSVVPRALFSSDGSMHHCPKKSDLMKI